MKNLYSALDPLGNTVQFPEEFEQLEFDQPHKTEVYDHPTKVVERPALMLQVSSFPLENYYLRSISWSDTLLIRAQQVEGQWIVHSAVKNPSREQIASLYQRAKIVG